MSFTGRGLGYTQVYHQEDLIQFTMSFFETALTWIGFCHPTMAQKPLNICSVGDHIFSALHIRYMLQDNVYRGRLDYYNNIIMITHYTKFVTICSLTITAVLFEEVWDLVQTQG